MTVWDDIWERCTVNQTTGRIELDGFGVDGVRVLAPQFRLDDGSEHAFVGFGTLVALNAYPDPGGVSQPIVLTSPSGTVFRTAEGRVLVRGTRTVTQEQSSG